MRVMVIGLRGIPAIEGGIEQHAEHLYPGLARRGCSIEVVTRSRHVPRDASSHWGNIRLTRIWAPKTRGLETVVHTLLAVFHAARVRPDILHIHAIGPALFAPLARLLGLRVVVTHHGFDYDREKWGPFAKFVLRLGERVGMRFAQARIVISQTIQRGLRERYQLDSVVIPNGVCIPRLPNGQSALETFELEPRRYLLLVSRFVPEKRHLDLIAAFEKADLPGWHLVLVGNLYRNSRYVAEVEARAAAVPGVVLTGFQKGRVLEELFAHAGLFVLPSSHEGLPIALLEALSFGLSVLASDIPAHLEIGLPEERYFQLGNVDQLAARLEMLARLPECTEAIRQQQAWVARRYDWEAIAGQTLDVYARLA